MDIKPRALFMASCLSLVATAICYSVSGDIVDALSRDFHLTKMQVGVLLAPVFWGEMISMLLTGSLLDFVGMRKPMGLASIGYVVAVFLVIFAPKPAGSVDPYYSDPGFLCLFSGMVLMGLARGIVDAVISPLAISLYPTEKTRRLNKLHAWWPGGIILGSLAAYCITRIMGLNAPGVTAAQATLGWQVKVALILIPSVLFGLIVLRNQFPKTERVQAGISTREMFREVLRPMFLLFFACMWLTSAGEVAPGQWVSSLITNLTGMQGILILAYTAGMSFLVRNYGGNITGRMSPMVLLTTSSLLTGIGLVGLGMVTSVAQAFVAATIFGVGAAPFWPTMLGVVSERFPRGGALAIAVTGAGGNLSIALFLPIIGSWYDAHGAATAFRYVAILPMILVVIFGTLIIYFKTQGGYKVVALESGKTPKSLTQSK